MELKKTMRVPIIHLTKHVMCKSIVAMLLVLTVGMAHGMQLHAMQPQGNPQMLTDNKGEKKYSGNEFQAVALKNVLSVDLENVTLEQGLNTVAQKAGLKLVYSTNIIPAHKRVSLQKSEMTLENVLWSLLADTGLRFGVSSNNHLVIMKWAKKDKKTVQPVQAETVSGTVTDAQTGETLPGVNILVKGTSTGASTDADGQYELEVESLQDTLVVSFVGYKTQQVPIDGRAKINVALQKQAISGEEMVVVGYGEQKKSNLTESVTQIDGTELAKSHTENLAESLQGKIGGLNVKNTGGRPGSNPTINIRGFTSINGGSPLVLVNGVEESLDKINPHDVESVTVLKDAAATSIYGSRGSYGVVLVQTKQPKAGEIQVHYNNSFKWKTPTTNKDFVTDPYLADSLVDESFRRVQGHNYTGFTQQDYQELRKRENDPSLPDVVTDTRNGKEQYIYYGHTDWWHTFFKKRRFTQTHNISISGGSDKFSGYFSGRFNQQDGIITVQDNNYNQYNIRGAIEFSANDWLTVKDNISVNADHQLIHGGTNNGWGLPYLYIHFHALPSYVPRNPDGTATYQTKLNNYTTANGSFASLLYGKARQITDRQHLNNTVDVTISPTEDLSLEAKYTNQLNFYQQTQRSTEFPWSIYPGQITYTGHDELQETRDHNTFGSARVILNYSHSINQHHHFKGKLGLDYEHQTYGNLSASKNNLLSVDLNTLNLGSSAPQANSTARKWVTLGYFARINYNYDGRYLIELNGRYDGTSRFRKDNRWGFFPSASVGWLVSDENFMKSVENVVSNLKLRASYGTVGNQQVGTYAYIPTLSRGTYSNYAIDGSYLDFTNVPALTPQGITWEKVTTANFGVDLSLLHNTIQTHLDLFQRETTGMITKGRTLPAVLGAQPPVQNAADLRTRGFEVQLSYQNTLQLAGKPFHFNVKGTVSNTTSIITKFSNPNELLSDYYNGQKLGDIWGYHINGLFKSDEEAANHADQTRVNSRIISSAGKWGHVQAGDVNYADLNEDGVINEGDNTLENPGDRRIIGNATPQFPYSFTIEADWNHIDFSVFFQGIGKQEWYPSRFSKSFWAMYNRPYETFQRKDLVNDIWSSDNPDGYFPRLRGYTAHRPNSELSTVNDRYLQNIAYLRLKNLTIGYTLPLHLTENLHLSRIRFYVSGKNLLTFSPLTNYVDPEAASNGVNLNNAATATDQARAYIYPFSKVYSAGLYIDF